MPNPSDPFSGLPIRRRDVLRGAGVLGAAGVLAACRRNIDERPRPVAPQERPPIEEEPGDLKIYEWAGYEAKWLWRDYARAGFPEPRFTFFTNTQEAIARTVGGYRWDISHPESTEFPQYVEEGLIQPWDTSLLEQWDSLNPELQRLGVWEDEQYEVVLDWGYSGVIIRSDEVDPDINSYNYLLDDAYEGHISWWDTVAMLTIAGLVLDVESDPNAMSAADLEASKNLLISKKKNLHSIWTDYTQMWDNIRTGAVWTAYSWPDTYVVLKDEVPVHYSKPREGVLGWAEGLILHSETENFFHAHEYADAWAAPDVGQRLVSTWGYGHSNLDIDLDQIDPEVVDAFGLNDPIGSLQATVFGHHVPQDVNQAYQRAWDEVKAA